MNYFLVDYENVKTHGLDGISKLNDDDVVCNNKNEVEVTSPHPRPMRKRKRAPALMTPYTDLTKRRKF